MQRCRRELARQALRITDALAPDLHTLIERVRRDFGVSRAIEAYQLANASERESNAGVRSYDEVILIVFSGQLLAQLDTISQLYVIGHELGHHLAHSEPPPWLPQRAVAAHPELSTERVAAALRMASELTADRFGLLACRDLDAALRAQMVLTAGLPAASLGWRTGAYLDQSRAVIDDLRSCDEAVAGETHPEHSLRAYAAWLFSESDAFHELTALGPGTRPLPAIDRELAALLGLPPALLDTPAPSAPRRPTRPPPSWARLETPSLEPAPARITPSFDLPGAPPPASPRTAVPPSRSSPPSAPPPPARPASPPTRPDGAPLEAWLGRGQQALARAGDELAGAGARLRDAAADVRPEAVATTLADTARRTREGLVSLAGSALGRLRSPAPAPPPEPEPDPLGDDERALIARFEELERRMKDR